VIAWLHDVLARDLLPILNFPTMPSAAVTATSEMILLSKGCAVWVLASEALGLKGRSSARRREPACHSQLGVR
jgi:hypothetical protein